MIYAETAEIIPSVKLLLGIDNDEKDKLLELMTDNVISSVLAYCRLEALPYQLRGIIAQMTAAEYRTNDYGSGEIPMDIASISEGQRSISFAERSGLNKDFTKQLEPWVNRRGRVPSDIG